jgi:hypothetical protein
MRKVIASILLIMIAAVLVQQVCATMIVVIDGNGYRSPNVKVEIYKEGQSVIIGYTDNSGIFYYNMPCGPYYRVDANGYSQSGEWQGNCPGYEIDIYMR